MNREQQAAVDATGLVFVSAGAGTGKTMVLVERFVRAVCDDGLDVASVLVITYTKRAAGELRSRIALVPLIILWAGLEFVGKVTIVGPILGRQVFPVDTSVSDTPIAPEQFMNSRKSLIRSPNTATSATAGCW